MPLVIPEFVQYQAPLFPLRGLWNTPPVEGDRFVNAEIDWGSPGLLGVSTVQFQLSGNSPVAFSQIVALSVDNSRCGSDVDFIFPDSGFLLTVPGFNQGVYPVFTNALMFYASASLATAGDITVFQILNSMPPPVAIQPSSEQERAGVSGLTLANQNVQIIPLGTSGTLNAFSIPYNAPGTGVAQLALVDGSGATLWTTLVDAPSQGSFSLSGLHLRFQNGLSFTISGSSISGGTVQVNTYYSLP